ncbi:MAG: hypothetical protein OFPI_00140 [Osedax symbiont Rs2]|nr:MAG: hypothetical protein OFPI_00140 [Osedax symbiont Rs2]
MTVSKSAFKSTFKSVLPPNSSKLERALEQVTAQALNLPVIIKQLHNPDTCPTALLPWLAWSLSVDEWDKNWSEENQRQTIRDSRQIHREKGTKASIRRVLASVGFANIRIDTGLDAGKHQGQVKYDGSFLYGSDVELGSFYSIYLNQPITIQQAAQIRRMLENTAPARCALKALHFEEAQATFNGAIKYSGTYTYGVA